LSQLVVIAYKDEGTAKQALGTLARLSKEQLINLEDAAYVTRSGNGKPKLHQTHSLTGGGAAGGAFWGFLIGLIFFVPIFGLAVGAASGALAGKFTDLGIDDKFMKEVGEAITPGTSALFLLVRSATADKVIPEMAQYGGKVIKTSLSTEKENELKEALSHPNVEKIPAGA
jgi:uncharacterized membrane protein